VARLGSSALPKPTLDSADQGISVRAPSGKSVTIPVPSQLRDVETKAFMSRTAKEAAAEYEKFLQNADLQPALRLAAESRLAHWSACVSENKVRLGDDWITEDESSDRKRRATAMVDHAVELLRLGNGLLAREELRVASQLNPESGRADFLAGLLYSLMAGNEAKGIECFEEVVRRDPNDSAALNNLAVCEVMNKKTNAALGHFRRALQIKPDAQVVADNLGVMSRAAGVGRTRIAAKTLADCNDLYREAIADHGLQPLSDDRADGFSLLGEDGLVWSRETAAALIRSAGSIEGSGENLQPVGNASPAIPSAEPVASAEGQSAALGRGPASQTDDQVEGPVVDQPSPPIEQQ